jgi:proline racemase
VEETTVGGLPAVIPEISGSAWITGFHQFVLQDQDQLNQGFFLL